MLPGMPPHLPAALICNNMEAMLGAAVAGMGLAYMPDFLARDALGRGELQRVLAEDLTHTGQFSALWASSRQLSPKVRAFVDFVGRGCSRSLERGRPLLLLVSAPGVARFCPWCCSFLPLPGGCFRGRVSARRPTALS